MLLVRQLGETCLPDQQSSSPAAAAVTVKPSRKHTLIVNDIGNGFEVDERWNFYPSTWSDVGKRQMTVAADVHLAGLLSKV